MRNFFKTTFTCTISGLALDVSYAPYHNPELKKKIQEYTSLTHPIFILEYRDLELDYLAVQNHALEFDTLNIQDNETLKRTPAACNAYLHMMAWVQALGVTWYVPSEPWSTYVKLCKVFERLTEAVRQRHAHPTVDFPEFVAEDAHTIAEQVEHWIEIIFINISAEYAQATLNKTELEVIQLEHELEEIQFFDQPVTAAKYATVIARWADLATGFPSCVTDYWRQIIVALFKVDNKKLAKLKLTQADLSELTDHCTEHLPHGSLYAYALLDRLRHLRKYGITIPSLTGPVRSEYSTTVAYLKARLEWQQTKGVRTPASTVRRGIEGLLDSNDFDL